jgi:hypothetical protein
MQQARVQSTRHAFALSLTARNAGQRVSRHCRTHNVLIIYLR